ncbi:protein of unknown function [Pseudorhizobium banfieldiae]|uniref:Uncharacterized protein n=1 Tax=Pseudorhizobium banfieldiae TaxID=1125847 RepID=L0NHF6_9HYPH|nr:protein of unknown function [Pseudorhizobium banfieldiae]
MRALTQRAGHHNLRKGLRFQIFTNFTKGCPGDARTIRGTAIAGSRRQRRREAPALDAYSASRAR